MDGLVMLVADHLQMNLDRLRQDTEMVLKKTGKHNRLSLSASACLTGMRSYVYESVIRKIALQYTAR